MTMKDTPQLNVCIVGCGDIGRRVAKLWREQGAAVTGIVRSESSLSQLSGMNGVLCDLASTESGLPELAENTVIYYFAPPPSTGKQDIHCQRFLSMLAEQKHLPERIIAISTTGVYGNREGGRVTEDDEPHPQVDRAYRRYDMENQLRRWCQEHDVALIILRVGGIYGPGRLPLARIKKQIPVLHEALAPQTNRIHADDLAMICKAAATVAHRYRIYNVSDGTDSNMTEYFFTLADYFNLPRPPAVDWPTAEATMSEGMLSYLRESRRIDNSRMLSELGIVLTYPDLMSGLASCKTED